MKRCFVCVAVCCLISSMAWAATGKVLILHTNDLHEHIRASAGGVGGMPYLAGYVAAARAERPGSLLLDSGDVMEKGDMLAYLTKAQAMYEAMNRVGFDASAPGNHDLAYGLENLRACAKLGGFPLLSINLVDPDNKPIFETSKIFDVDGVKVGVIGAITSAYVTNDPKAPARALEINPTIDLIVEEVKVLDPQCDLLVLLCHLGSKACLNIAERVPQIDVFLSGHSHERLDVPIVSEASGALILQTGAFASSIGRLDLTVDLGEKRIVESDFELVTLDHDTTPLDKELANWVAEREQEVCPQAAVVLGHAAREIRGRALAQMFADAIRAKSGAEIAVDSPNMLRATLPAGPIEYNTVFKAYIPGGRAAVSKREAVLISIKGADLLDYLEKGMAKRGAPAWVGFAAEADYQKPEGERVLFSDLEPGRTYQVALSRVMLTALATAIGKKPEAFEAKGLEFNVIDAMAEKIQAMAAEGAEIGAEEAAAAAN